MGQWLTGVGNPVDMEDELDISRAAELLICQHGAGAFFVAVQRADALLAQRDRLGYAVWTQIGRAIDGLTREKPRAGEAIN